MINSGIVLVSIGAALKIFNFAPINCLIDFSWRVSAIITYFIIELQRYKVFEVEARSKDPEVGRL